MPGKSGYLLEMTMPRSVPLLKWPVIVPSARTTPSTCPPSRAVTAGEAPVNGTVMRPAPVSELSVSTQKSPTDPAPGVLFRVRDQLAEGPVRRVAADGENAGRAHRESERREVGERVVARGFGIENRAEYERGVVGEDNGVAV